MYSKIEFKFEPKILLRREVTLEERLFLVSKVPLKFMSV